jgi:hypothetical protein
VFEYSIRDFFEAQKVNFDVGSCELHVGFRASVFEYSIQKFFEAQKLRPGWFVVMVLRGGLPWWLFGHRYVFKWCLVPFLFW